MRTIRVTLRSELGSGNEIELATEVIVDGDASEAELEGFEAMTVLMQTMKGMAQVTPQ